MVRDYSTRRQVSKNRPKKQPVNLFVFLVAGAIVTAFSFGVMTGWLIFRPGRHQNAVVPAAGNQPAASSSEAKAQNEDDQINDPPLTFYDTLTKGKVVIGTGLNPDAKPVALPTTETPKAVQPRPSADLVRKSEKSETSRQTDQKNVPSASVPAAAPSRKAVKNPPAPRPKKAEELATKKTAAGKFSVQVAMCSDRKEADRVVAKMNAHGVAAYVVKLEQPGKGAWYRVRVGKHLDLKTANVLASKAGKGAIVLPE